MIDIYYAKGDRKESSPEIHTWSAVSRVIALMEENIATLIAIENEHRASRS